MDSKNLIQNMYLDLKEKIKGTDEVHMEMKEELLELIEEEKKQMDDDEYRRYRDKVFQIAEVGEEKGFVRGFRFAFQLFLECIRD